MKILANANNNYVYVVTEEYYKNGKHSDIMCIFSSKESAERKANEYKKANGGVFKVTEYT